MRLTASDRRLLDRWCSRQRAAELRRRDSTDRSGAAAAFACRTRHYGGDLL